MRIELDYGVVVFWKDNNSIERLVLQGKVEGTGARAFHPQILVTLLSLSLVTGVPQKPNLDAILNRRTDVYIAGFFPFGKGVENSNTGIFR
ncbi:jg16864 [Pararge aegeria aegeria]|uniref:Jg16864 protein n=1 Tax=Pararge aegeria aegeria TaxID=348720 RepID=A0A8S4SPK0_9NEOP|nr:jg16864 [Pararge aegeria aegeria]